MVLSLLKSVTSYILPLRILKKSEPQKSVSTRISNVDLTQDPIKEPLNAYGIEESCFGVAQYSPKMPYIITSGLYSCKAIVFYNHDSQKGLLCHLSAVRDLKKLIQDMIDHFGEDFSKTEVHVIRGVSSGTQGLYSPTIEEIISEISKNQPRELFVANEKMDEMKNMDRAWKTGELRKRSIALNLETGEVSEIDKNYGWTWSNEHDTSINVDIYDLQRDL